MQPALSLSVAHPFDRDAPGLPTIPWVHMKKERKSSSPFFLWTWIPREWATGRITQAPHTQTHNLIVWAYHWAYRDHWKGPTHTSKTRSCLVDARAWAPVTRRVFTKVKFYNSRTKNVSVEHRPLEKGDDVCSPPSFPLVCRPSLEVPIDTRQDEKCILCPSNV